MRAPDFWWRDRPTAAARLLAPLGGLYGAVTARRMARAGIGAGVPVVCVGNLVAGGAGKTPTAIALARLLRERGEAPAFLSRGYGGRLKGPVAVDPAIHGAGDVGDEPLLLAGVAPAFVARDRVAGATLAAPRATVIVMDDGLQNPSLVKDLTIAAVDGATGIGNGLCVPAGPLRAPLASQLGHLDAVVVIGKGHPGEAVAARAASRGLRVMTARLVPDAAMAAALSGKRLLAFAGIGRPEKFFATLEALGAIVAERVSLPDHHRFGAGEIEALLARAARDGLMPVTTEKDAARLRSVLPAPDLARRLAVLPVTLAFDDADAVRALLATIARPTRA